VQRTVGWCDKSEMNAFHPHPAIEVREGSDMQWMYAGGQTAPEIFFCGAVPDGNASFVKPVAERGNGLCF